VLGGEWRSGDAGPYFFVETRVEPSAAYGRSRVGDIGERLDQAASVAPLVAGGAPAHPPFVFFDLETTGLAGGAGTYVFLIGCGEFIADGAFVTRQFLLTRMTDERPLLAAVRAEFGRVGALVSFNGKSFDAQVLETRYLFHRSDWVGRGLPHIDILDAARRFWGAPVGQALQARLDVRDPKRVALQTETTCSLTALEWKILGGRRAADVEGYEIPARYFRFVRSGDARPLAAVFEHNRLDLLSLAGLTARLLELIRAGASAARDVNEALALGAVYARGGCEALATDAYKRAISLSTAASMPPVSLIALRALERLSRRARQYEEAAG